MIKLIRMLPDQAAHYWPILSKGFARSLPPGTFPSEMLLNNLLASVLKKNYDCWILKGDRGDKNKLIAGALTTVLIDHLTGSRPLLIYSLYAKTMLSDKEWKEAFELLSKVAAKNKCQRITAYSMNPSILSIVESLGGKSEMRLVELEVKDGG